MKNEVKKFNKVVLLYSGGLDTSVLLKWIQENYGAKLVTLTADLGQPDIELAAIKKKALALGAEKAYVVDVKKEFAYEYVAKAIKANALYEGTYPLSTAIGRPLIAKLAVEVAEKEGADAIAHGCTGKGNDQVRLEVGIACLNPALKVLAPVREWGLSREEELAYAKKHGIPVPAENKSYSTDENLWGKSTEGGILEDPAQAPPDEVYSLVSLPENAPDTAEIVELQFEAGLPTALNGKKLELHEFILALNPIAAKHGVGIYEHMEDRIVGLKTREFYECPAAECILKAHKELEKYVHTIHENTFKQVLEDKWSYMAYAGLWHDPLMASLNAFMDKSNENVEGTAKLKLYKGSCRVASLSSPYALYNLNLATYGKGSTFDQNASKGFIELWGLQSKLANHIAKSAKNIAKNPKAKTEVEI
ncbi:MAG: argininosuccinate synthase [Candidatus Burarchaeum sp.]|nr:argininosuccinate synthase [Candidatus Burarchaeum sp.]MDO8339642.1 argininosuccinate synthase [Candidatus Burarchaeum sp.]